MKQLTESDIELMGNETFVPDVREQNRVRAELHLSQRIPRPAEALPACVVIDFHNKTEEQAWNELTQVIQSGARNANVITGASGILKIKFQQWMRDSVLSPFVISCTPINNGSFNVRFKKH